MKKFLSILLCLVLLFSINAYCFADEAESNSEYVPELSTPPIPALEVTIWIDQDISVVYENDIIIIYSSLTNSEYYENISYQWQISTDGSSWSDLDGETGETCEIVASEATTNCYYKLVVNYMI